LGESGAGFERHWSGKLRSYIFGLCVFVFLIITLQIVVNIQLIVEFNILVVNLGNLPNFAMRSGSINDIRDAQIGSNTLNVIDGIRSKEPFQETSDEINHDPIALLAEDRHQLSKDLHAFFSNDQPRGLANWGTFLLYMEAELGGELEDRVGCNGFWNIFVTFFLVADMDKPVINAHFKFRWRRVSRTLIFVKFFKTLKGLTVRSGKEVYIKIIPHCS
jgi:hypothetical protein